MAIDPPGDGLVGLAPIAPRAALGLMPNEQHQTYHGFMRGAPGAPQPAYCLAIVEFDDQGRCYDRGQMDAVAGVMTQLMHDEADVILLVFVHGWKHDARTDDEDLSEFRRVLMRVGLHERNTAAGRARPVMGIFIGWRGMSEYGVGDIVADSTFWGRQAAAQRVATGSVRELFGRLRHYRNHRLTRDRSGSPLLVIAGHSFGGMIVYSALSQSLIEAASAPGGLLTPSFADLVLLVNPAIEGARYLPIYDLVKGAAFRARNIPQPPVFICAQAENDQPVGTFFPIGNFTRRLDQATIGDLEKACTTHAIGFIPEFRTHRLTGSSEGASFRLDPPGERQENPYWVVGADKAVINNHSGIWQQPFQDFLADILLEHVEASRR
ncbi:MAG: hypothetical protein P0Y64_13260 [Candidatus Sphingomonas colombiensis]|nr:hypothetical protein [Sphingomonas sp.]WEK42352.1 MAG: hypothetical protein P0Y64_13260 [Sphingomonas sp.]